MFWNSLPEDTKKSLEKTFKAFDKKYADKIKQGFWQMKYENLKYAGPQKESLDDLAVRIKDIVSKAYPDTKKQGVVHSKYEVRKLYTRRKFWELMPYEIRQSIYLRFGVSTAPLRLQLEHAQRFYATQENAREEQPYGALCHVQQEDQSPTKEIFQQIASAISNTNEKLHKMGEEVRNFQEETRKSQRNWQQKKQNWQKNQQGQQQNWQNPPQQWQASPQQWQNPPQQWQNPPQQNWQQNWQDQNQQNTGQQQQQGQQKKPVVCWQCNKPGHTKRECRHNPENKQNQGPQGQGNQRQWTPTSGSQGQGNSNGQGQRYGKNNRNQQTQQGYLPSKSGHPQDIREKKAPMNAMPVDRVPAQQMKQKINMCEEEEFDFMNHIEFDAESSLN